MEQIKLRGMELILYFITHTNVFAVNLYAIYLMMFDIAA